MPDWPISDRRPSVLSVSLPLVFLPGRAYILEEATTTERSPWNTGGGRWS